MSPKWISKLEFGPPHSEFIEATIEYTDGTSECRKVDGTEAKRLQAEAEADAQVIMRGLGFKQPPEMQAAPEAAYTNSSEEFGSQEHSVVMDAILGRGNY